MFDWLTPPPRLLWAVPNENWEVLLQFESQGHRKFKASVARNDKGMAFLAQPDLFKSFDWAPDGIDWGSRGRLDVRYLLKHSEPMSTASLSQEWLRLDYKNQAPTELHPNHHVYYVYLYPFCAEPITLGESIGGGHAEMGGARSFDREALLSFKGWQLHFRLAGCEWAIPIVEQHAEKSAMVHALSQAAQQQAASRHDATAR